MPVAAAIPTPCLRCRGAAPSMAAAKAASMTSSLLPQIAAGNLAAIEQFLRRHSAMVWGLARRYCRSAEDAEDATQDIFVEIWKSAGRYDATQGSELTFAMTIARRRLIDRVRRLGRRPPEELLLDASAVVDRQTDDELERQDEVRRAEAAMQQLRTEQRQVLELALGHGRTHVEIAAAIGIPLGTVKSHARRGLIRLREMLGADDGGGGTP